MVITVFISTSAVADEASSIFACRDWIKLLIKIDDGVLTMGEVRSEVKALYEGNARLSHPPIRNATRGLLRALTTGTDKDQGNAVRALTAACKEVIRRNPSRF